MSRQLQLKQIVGKLIAKKRKEAKLSQAVLAEMVNLSTEGYARYERGESSPDVMFLNELANIFKCGVDELIVETSTGLTAQAQHIANMLDGVSTSDREKIVQIVENVCAIAHKKQKFGQK